MSPLDLYARVRFYTCNLHTRPRVPARIRLSLRPLTGEGVTSMQTSGECRREIAKSCLDLSTSLRAQRSNPFFLFRARWIASSQALLAMTLRRQDPVVRMEPTAAQSGGCSPTFAVASD